MPDLRTWNRCTWIALLGTAVVGAAQAASTDAEPKVKVVVESPTPGSVVRGRFDLLELSGLAQAGEREANFDVVLIVDVSGSSLYPSGIDIDGDGVVGVKKPALVPGLPDTKNTDPDDSIFAAELLAAQRMLEALNPERVRVGLVTFSGEADPITYKRRRPDQQDAWLEQALTSDYDQVRAALEAVRLRGASGGTNMEAGLKLAVQELAGLAGAVSQARPDSRKVALMLTDGYPSLPFGRVMDEDPEDIEATIAAARLAADAGILINVFGLGPGATNYPFAVTEVCRETGGLYTPVQRPGDVVTLLTGVSFANVDDVVAVNLTTGQLSGPQDMAVLPDGSFRGFVPVQPGLNRIRVSALASDGSRGSEEFEVQFLPQELSNNELGEELDRVRNRNRDIQVLTERRRQEVFREAERSRALTVQPAEDSPAEPEKPKPGSPTPPAPRPAPATGSGAAPAGSSATPPPAHR